MALWDTLGSGMDQHFAPELFAGTSKTTTFYKGLTVIAYHSQNVCFITFLSMLPICCILFAKAKQKSGDMYVTRY